MSPLNIIFGMLIVGIITAAAVFVYPPMVLAVKNGNISDEIMIILNQARDDYAFSDPSTLCTPAVTGTAGTGTRVACTFHASCAHTPALTTTPTVPSGQTCVYNPTYSLSGLECDTASNVTTCALKSEAASALTITAADELTVDFSSGGDAEEKVQALLGKTRLFDAFGATAVATSSGEGVEFSF